MERKEAFLQKVTELSEDPGSARYPEGYTYTAGTMHAGCQSGVCREAAGHGR